MCRKLEELFESKFSNCPTDDPLDPANSRPPPVQQGLLVPHTPQVLMASCFTLYTRLDTLFQSFQTASRASTSQKTRARHRPPVDSSGDGSDYDDSDWGKRLQMVKIAVW